MNSEEILFFFSFFLISIFATFFVIIKRNQIADYFNLIDKPDIKRKIHKSNTPIVATFSLVFFFIILLFTDLFLLNIFDDDFQIIIFISLCLFVVGVIDDKFTLNPYQKIIIISLIFFFYDTKKFFFNN